MSHKNLAFILKVVDNGNTVRTLMLRRVYRYILSQK